MIVENRAYLSEIDGKIGDGDHGVNMAKGFGLAAERIEDKDMSLAQALDTLRHGADDRDRRLDGAALRRDVHPVRRGDRQGAVDRRRDLQRHADQRAATASSRSARLRSATRRFWMRWCRRSPRSMRRTLQASHLPRHSTISRRPPKRGATAPRTWWPRSAAPAGWASVRCGVLDAGATSCALILKTLGAEVRARL